MAQKPKEFDIHAAVLALEADVLRVRDYFDDIYNALDRLEKESTYLRIKSWIGTTPAGEWDAIRKEYDRLLRDSRRLATAVAAGAEDFRTDMIPLLQDTIVPFTEKRRTLAKFIADMKETDTSAEEISQGFVDIPRKIRNFRTSYASKLERGRQKIDDRIHRLNREIEGLVKSIEKHKAQHDMLLKELREEIPIQGDDVVGDLILTAIGELLGPAGCRSLLSKVFGDTKTTGAVTKAQANLTQAKEDLSAKERELTILETDVSNLEQLIPSRVKAAESSTDHICGRLGAIGKIWAVVRTDAQTLHNQLNKAHNASEEKEFRRLILERTRIIPLYENLEKVLYRYANAVIEY